MSKPTKIVFTGITGLLGSYFLKKTKSDYEIIGTGNKNVDQESDVLNKLDITDKKAVLDFIKKINPEVIVHAASLGNVDYCESHPIEAIKVNVEGTRNLIEAAKQTNSKIIFLSSNAVYDGINPPFDESHTLKPVDVYGKTKAEGEKLVLKSGLDYVILRLITMYGWAPTGGRGNFVTWVIENLENGNHINVVNDVYNNNLWVGQAADVIWSVLEKNANKDSYNIAGGDCINRFNLALKIAEIFELDSSLITPVDSSFFKGIAKRPKNTCFNTLKMEKELGIKPLSVAEGLAFMKREYDI